jgi:hypothetical protein
LAVAVPVADPRGQGAALSELPILKPAIAQMQAAGSTSQGELAQ